MIESFCALPYVVQLLVVGLVGLVAGSFVNWAAFSLTTMPRAASPWSRAHSRDEYSSVLDRVPLLGWVNLRHRGREFGYDFWIRPIVVELICCGLFVALYHWEVGKQGLVFQLVPAFPQAAPLSTVFAQFAVHSVLLTLMVAVTLIDVDDYIIPDELIVPGTCLAMVFAVLWPNSHLPDLPEAFIHLQQLNALVVGRPLQLASPHSFPASLGGWPQGLSLAIGLACWLGWCFGLLPRTWYARHGWGRALVLCWESVRRRPGTGRCALLALVGAAAITAMWVRGGWRWESLLSALVGLGVGGGVIWYIRIVGTWTLRREAMGFGDVTLLAMIGAFLGWQAALLTFFAAPFAGAILGIIKKLAGGDGVIPYGPFLCLGAVTVVASWISLWDALQEWFIIPWMVPAAFVVCMVAIVPILLVYRLLRYGGGDPYEPDDSLEEEDAR